MKKKIIKILVPFTFALLYSINVLAAGSYSSTYSMTGGVFSRKITPKSYVTTTVSPETGVPDTNIGVIWAKKYWYGWDGPVKYVSSTKGGSATHNSSETRQIWLRNYTGHRITGNVHFNWN